MARPVELVEHDCHSWAARLLRSPKDNSPRHGDVDDRAEEEKYDELGYPASHGKNPSQQDANRSRPAPQEVTLARRWALRGIVGPWEGKIVRSSGAVPERGYRAFISARRQAVRDGYSA